MTIIKLSTLGALICGAFFASSLLAQEVVTEPAAGEPTTGTEVPSQETSPFTQLSPDDGSLRAGAAPGVPLFDIPRRIHFAAGVLGGYDDNVNLTPNGSPSWYANPTANFSYTFGSSRLAFTVLAGAGLTYYFDHPDGRDYDPDLHVQLSLAYKVTPRLTLDFSTDTSYQAQPDFSTATSVNFRLGSYFRSESRLSANYRFTPRFSTTTSYRLDTLEYNSSEGSLNDRLQHTFSQEARYLLFPTTTATAEYRFSFTNFANGAADSSTNSFIAGVDQSFSPRLTASVKGGLQLRSIESGGNQTSPYVEGTVRYALQTVAPGGTSSGSFISWTNRYSIEESDIPSNSGRDTFRTNLQVGYAFTARMSGTLDVVYLHGDNGGSSAASDAFPVQSSGEDVFDIGPSFRYAITRYFAVTLGYRYSEVDRGLALNAVGQSEAFSFTRNRFFAGVNITF